MVKKSATMADRTPTTSTPKAINNCPRGVTLLDPNEPNNMAFILETAVVFLCV